MNSAPDEFASSTPDEETSPCLPAFGDSELAAAPGDVIEGKYKYILVDELGRGGFGKVFLGECISPMFNPLIDPPRQVAVKIFTLSRLYPVVRLAKRELSGILAFRHDHVPRVFDWSLGNRPFVVLEYFPEGSLQDQIAGGVRLTYQQAWTLLRHLLSALTAAHSSCLLHLDVKPGNVLIDKERGFMLSDFGISQGTLVPHHIISSGLGSPLYSSPEQLQKSSGTVDIRADLWGVGITCWCAVSGVDNSTLKGMREKKPEGGGMPALSSLLRDCPPELSDLLGALLEEDPEKRPGSAAEVLAYVEAVTEGKASQAIPTWKSRFNRPGAEEVAEVIESLIDPLWHSICADSAVAQEIVKLDDGDVLCKEGDQSYHAYILLRGTVRVTKAGKFLSLENREGTFLGEIATLTGARRTATMEAVGEVWALAFNGAQLEAFIHRHPAAAMRLVKSLAERCSFSMGR